MKKKLLILPKRFTTKEDIYLKKRNKNIPETILNVPMDKIPTKCIGIWKQVYIAYWLTYICKYVKYLLDKL